MKILFIYADDAYFWRNRLGLACEARDQGFEVVLMAPISQYRAEIEKEGIRVIPWNLSRKSVNPFRELRSLLEVMRAYRRERPDIVQHETLKAVLHGGTASRFCGELPSLNVICGLGAIFTQSNFKMATLRRIVLRMLAMVFRSPNARVAFHNEGDRDVLVKRYSILKAEKAIVSPGNGVHIEKFTPQPEPAGTPMVVLPGRMLWEKGIAEFVEAGGELRRKGVSARFVLVGAPDFDNPGCISEEQLRAWEQTGAVEWWGSRNDMPAIYAQSTVVCLPSYAEGLPNVLAEAGASGRAVVTTDVPGCLQAVAHEVNGLIVPVRDAKALSGAIERLLKDHELRRRLGAMGRERAVKEFSHTTIVNQMLGIYEKLLGGKWASAEFQTSEEKAEALTEA